MSWGPQTNPNGTALTGRRSTLPPVGDLVEDLRNGMTLADMADVYGVSADRIRQVVNNAGYSSIDGEPTVRELVAEMADLAAAIPPPGPWVDDALCAQVGDDRLWFPNKGGSTRQAKAICARCPVAAQCLDYALAVPASHDYGIFGGTSERERRDLRRALQAPDAVAMCRDCGTTPAQPRSARCAACAAARKKATDAAWWRNHASRRTA